MARRKPAAKPAAPAKGKGKTKEEPKKQIPRGRKGATWGLPTGRTWYRLMSENAKKKLTDQQMADFMQSEFPGGKKYSTSDVKMHRGLYNRGRFAWQNGEPDEIPKELLHEYNEKGEKMPLRGTGKKKVKPKDKDTKDENISDEDEDDDVEEEDEDEDDDDDEDDEDDI